MAAKAASKTTTTTKTTASKPAAAKATKTTLSPDPVAAPAPVATGATIGFFDVATVERKPWGILALIFNILPGGVGTIIAGAKVGNTGQIIKGILQFVLTWTVLAWIWSLVDGIRMFTRSTQ